MKITRNLLRLTGFMTAGLTALAAPGCLPEDEALASDPSSVEADPNAHVWSRTFYADPFDIEDGPIGKIRIHGNSRGDVLIKAGTFGQSVVGFEDAAIQHPSSGRLFIAMMDLDHSVRWSRYLDDVGLGCAHLANDGTVVAVSREKVQVFDADGFEQRSWKFPPPLEQQGCGRALAAPSGALYVVSLSALTAYNVSKWNSSGSNLWRRQVTGFSALSDVVLDSSENIVLAGGEGRVQVVKLKASDGNLAWRKELTDDLVDDRTLREGARGVAAGSDDAIYLTGNFRGSLPIAGDLEGRGSIDAFVAKFDASGRPLWGRALGGPDEQSGEGISVTSEGVVVTGRFRGSIDFGAGPVSSYAVEKDDVFVAAFDHDGNALWSRRYGDSVAQRGFTVTGAPGGAIIGGIGAGTMTFGGPSFPPPPGFLRDRNARWFLARLAPPH